MTGDHVLDFYQNREGTLLLPKQCGVSVACYDSKEVQQAIVLSIYESLHALALSGMDLRALDGVTVALDARKAACELQSLPEGAVPLERSSRDDGTCPYGRGQTRSGVPVSHRYQSWSRLDDAFLES